MTDRTARTGLISPSAAMLPPLAVFFAACFLFAGVVKFRLHGGDLWLAKPAGAIVTCLFLALVGMMAGRWFFGNPPRAIGKRVLSALVVLLPLMGMLGAFQLATTRDPEAAALDPAPLGGSLGRLLAGPKAFGLVGPIAAGILFATLAGIGALLARRMASDDRKTSGDDPYSMMRAANSKREAPVSTAAAATAVIEEEAPPREGGSLFPVDAELEPDTATASVPMPMGSIETIEEEISEVVEPPKRMPVLAGIVEESPEEPAEELPAARFLASTLVLEPEAKEDMILDLDEPAFAPIRQEAEVEIEMPMGSSESTPEAEPETETPAPRINVAPAPRIENEDEPSLESEPEDEPMDDEPELAEITGGEAPELTLEWLAAPRAFHTPRLIDPVVTNEAMEDILDVETAKEPVEPRALDHPHPNRADARSGTPGRLQPASAEPEPAPVPERPRFRVKAVVEQDETPAEVAEPPVVNRWAQIASDLDRQLQPTSEMERRLQPASDEMPSDPDMLEVPASMVEKLEAMERALQPASPESDAAPVVEEPVVEKESRPRRRRRRASDEDTQEVRPEPVAAESDAVVADEPMTDSWAQPASTESEADLERPLQPASAESESMAVEEAAPAADEPAAEAPVPTDDETPRPRRRRQPKAGIRPVEQPAAEAPASDEAEAQLELPSMPEAPAAPASETTEPDENRPKRRMRSARKDWASWDEPSKERPRLRLVKSEGSDEQQNEIPVSTGGGDDSYDRAVAVVVKEDRCSVSLLQRNLGVTFGEATALIDRMYQQGVVGPYQPTGRRDVLIGKKGAAASSEES